MVESLKSENRTVTVKFRAGQTQPIISYLRLLIRKHLEFEFENDIGVFYIKHEGGKMQIGDFPNFKYESRYHTLIHKKHNLTTSVKNAEKNSADFYRSLNKLSKIDHKLKKIEFKHQQEVRELKTPYINKMLYELSGIFEDLLTLISDAHEVTVT